jgi:hypothetical protein
MMELQNTFAWEIGGLVSRNMCFFFFFKLYLIRQKQKGIDN